MQVPLLDLKAQYAAIKQETLAAVATVLDSQLVCDGPAVRELEKQVAAYSGCRFGIGVTSGTDALLVALMALEIGPGDEVITTPFTFFATAGTIWRVGAKPVFVDIQADTFNIDPAKIEAAITPRTRAIMPVHLYGQLAEMDAIMDIARRHKLHVIEDAAQAIGAECTGRRAGSIGTMGCLSFYPTKNLGALGDAGMVVTQDEALAAKLVAFRIHGSGGTTYIHKWVGGNFRMDSLQAAALSVKLRHLDQWTQARQANAAAYDKLLATCPQVETPPVRPSCRHIYNQYVIRADCRDDLRKHLNACGVASGVYYPLSLHLQECFASLGHKEGDFPVSEQATREVLALPVHPELTAEQRDYVVASIKSFYR